MCSKRQGSSMCNSFARHPGTGLDLRLMLLAGTSLYLLIVRMWLQATHVSASLVNCLEACQVRATA
jgi:hypothetical protein